MNSLSFSQHIKNRRLQLKLPLRKVAAHIDIDQSTLSKIERGERIAHSNLLKPLSEILQINLKELEHSYLSEKIISLIEPNEDAIEILKVAESKIRYNKTKV